MSGTFGYLRRNIENNGAANVRVHNIGAFDFKGEFFMGIGGAADSREFFVGGGSEKARFETLDGIAENFGLERIDYIKIDARAHEARVLVGGAETLRKFRPAVQMDVVKTSAFPEDSYKQLKLFIRARVESEGFRMYQLYKKITEVLDLDRFFAQDTIQNSIVLAPGGSGR